MLIENDKQQTEMARKKTILCPIDHRWQGGKNPLLFGVYYIEETAREYFHEDVEVRVMPFVQKRWDKWETLWLNIVMTWHILTTRHDILYYGIDPNNLMLLAMLKSFGLYRRPMYAWKYVALTRSKNRVVRWLKRRIYSAFDCIFMLTERHVAESVEAGIIPQSQCRFVKWGNDLEYIDSIPPMPRTGDGRLVFVSSGKAMRDFATLCKAFQGLDATLKIYAPKHWGGSQYQEVISQYDSPNIEVHYVEDLDTAGYSSVAEYLYAVMKSADCSVIICQKVNFGVGYTSVVDAMACGASIIATYNPDNPIDIDKEYLGHTVPAEDSSALRHTVQHLIDHPDEIEGFKRHARSLAENEHNIRHTVRRALETVLGQSTTL